jgi:hypothetical protein
MKRGEELLEPIALILDERDRARERGGSPRIELRDQPRNAVGSGRRRRRHVGSILRWLTARA